MDFSVSNDFGLDVSGDAWRPTATAERVAVSGNYDIFAVADAVRSLPLEYRDNYTKWIDVGRVLYNTDPDNLFTLWDQWSQGSEKYVIGETYSIWSGFGRGHCPNPLTIGSLFHWAKDTKRSESPIVSGESKQREFRFTGIKDFLAKDFPQNFLIKGCLLEGQSAVIGGGLKTLKTCMSMEAAVSLMSGSPFLSRFPSEKRRVTFMSGESGERTLQETANRIILAKGIQPDSYTNDDFQITSDLPLFNQPLESLETMLNNMGTQVLIIDPVYLCVDGDKAGNLFNMGAQYTNIGKMCAENDITVILNHHVTRAAGAANKPLSPSDLQWSGIAEFARQWWLINRRKDFVVGGNGDHSLFISMGGSSGLSQGLNVEIHEGRAPVEPGDPKRVWEVNVLGRDEVAAEKSDNTYQSVVSRVKKLFGTDNVPRSPSKIRGGTGNSGAHWPPLFDRMIEEGILVPTEETKNRTRKQFILNTGCESENTPTE